MQARTITAVSRGGIVDFPIRARGDWRYSITSSGLFAGSNPAGPISDLRKTRTPDLPYAPLYLGPTTGSKEMRRLSARRHDFRKWPISEVTPRLLDVRFSGHSGLDLLP